MPTCTGQPLWHAPCGLGRPCPTPCARWATTAACAVRPRLRELLVPPMPTSHINHMYCHFVIAPSACLMCLLLLGNLGN